MTIGELKNRLLSMPGTLENPYLEIRVLLSFLGISEIEQITSHGKEIDSGTALKAEELFSSRLAGTPMAYITHSKEFYGHTFYVDENTLIPRPDTELLVDLSIKTYKKKGYRGKILDLCTGSGAVAASIAHALSLPVSFSDISPKALKIAQLNYKKITGKEGDSREGSLFEPWKGEKFSLIATNPPYLTEEWFRETEKSVQREPHLALVSDEDDGLGIIKKIVLTSPQYLEKNGTLLIECDYRQTKTLSALLIKSGFENVAIAKDLSGLERVVYGEYRRD